MSFPVIRDATTGSQVAPSFLAQFDPSVVNYQNAPAAFLSTNPPVTADTDGVTFWMVYYAWMYWYLHNLLPTPEYTWSGDITNDLTGYTGPVYTYSPSTGYEANGVPINRYLVSIAVSPTSPSSLAVGETQQFKAVGTYSDGSTADITNTAGWTSSAPAFASINYQGLATGISSGNATITAYAVGQTTVTSNSVVLTVSGGSSRTLSLIEISPSTPSDLPVGSTQQFTALGTFSDGSTSDITQNVTWTSSKSGVAIIGTSTGLAAGIAVGNTSITASSSGITSQAVTLSVVTTMPNLISITVTPTSPASLPVGSTQQFTATGTNNDGTNDDITTDVTWTSSVPTIATISADGLASGVAAGNTNIKASISGITSPAITLTVTGVGPTPVKTTDYWESLLPMPPIEGPPLPAFMDVYWPWTKKTLTPVGNLQITVYDADTSLPLPKVAVTVVSSPGFLYEVFGRIVATTDNNGFCSFAVKKGTFSVQCAKMGYVTQAIQVEVGDTGGIGSVELAQNIS